MGGSGGDRLPGKHVFWRRGYLSPNLKKVMSEPSKVLQEGCSRQREQPLQSPLGGLGYCGWVVPSRDKCGQTSGNLGGLSYLWGSQKALCCASESRRGCAGQAWGQQGYSWEVPRHRPRRPGNQISTYLVSFGPTLCFSFQKDRLLEQQQGVWCSTLLGVVVVAFALSLGLPLRGVLAHRRRSSTVIFS